MSSATARVNSAPFPASFPAPRHVAALRGSIHLQRASERLRANAALPPGRHKSTPPFIHRRRLDADGQNHHLLALAHDAVAICPLHPRKYARRPRVVGCFLAVTHAREGEMYSGSNRSRCGPFPGCLRNLVLHTTAWCFECPPLVTRQGTAGYDFPSRTRRSFGSNSSSQSGSPLTRSCFQRQDQFVDAMTRWDTQQPREYIMPRVWSITPWRASTKTMERFALEAPVP